MNAPIEAGDLLDRLRAQISDSERGVLTLCETVCRASGVAIYLVGGAVRDLMLGRPNLDLDLAVEGAVAPVVEALAKATGGKAVLHERFGTASVSGPGFRLDFAQTRRETYSHPGALPTVEPVTSILEDLSRRDFTINAIALRITPDAELIDPFGGVADLRSGLVRVLHEGSFRDDATRMLRAARYAARLDFRLETVTQLWLERDLAYLDTISGPRLRRELSLTLEEPRAPDATELAARLGILGAVHARLHLDPDLAPRWREALTHRHYAPLDELGFCLIANPTMDDDVTTVSRRLHLAGRTEKALNDLVRLRALAPELVAAAGAPARAVDLLEGYAKAGVWALSLLDTGPAGGACEAYLSEWQAVKPTLRGNDLLALGVPPGETVGSMLKRLRAARLEGKAKSREDEMRIVRVALKSQESK